MLAEYKTVNEVLPVQRWPSGTKADPGRQMLGAADSVQEAAGVVGCVQAAGTQVVQGAHSWAIVVARGENNSPNVVKILAAQGIGLAVVASQKNYVGYQGNSLMVGRHAQNYHDAL